MRTSAGRDVGEIGHFVVWRVALYPTEIIDGRQVNEQKLVKRIPFRAVQHDSHM
jgi:hypothetical protein